MLNNTQSQCPDAVPDGEREQEQEAARAVGARGVRQGENVHLHQTCQRCLTMFLRMENTLFREGVKHG